MPKINFFLLIYLGKLVAAVSRLFNLGAGSTWPGHLALAVEPQILPWLISCLRKGTILVAGTNGKTTTAKMIRVILESGIPPEARFARGDRNQEGKKVVHNETGANLLNGITSSLIMATDGKGKIGADWGVFEVDEATLPLALKEFTPQIVVLLNLFRDQLDRYGEIDLIAQKWHQSLLNLPKSVKVILNADDPQIAYLGKNLKAKVFYFGLDDPQIFLAKKQQAMDSSFCPQCGTRLEFKGVFFSHLGLWKCSSCHLTRPKPDLDQWDYPLVGIYNRYNTLTAVLVAKVLGVNEEQIKQSLKNFLPAFGRLEEFALDNKKIRLLLSKNPTGFNESIRTLNEFPGNKTVLLVLNDRIPDGRDVSWIWDVDFEELVRQVKLIITSGDRVEDITLRIKYVKTTNKQINKSMTNYKLQMIKNLKEAMNFGLKKTEEKATLFVLPTYSAMLEVRKILTGKKIL